MPLHSHIYVTRKQKDGADDRIKTKDWGGIVSKLLSGLTETGEEREEKTDGKQRDDTLHSQASRHHRGGAQHGRCGENNPSSWIAIHLSAG